MCAGSRADGVDLKGEVDCKEDTTLMVTVPPWYNLLLMFLTMIGSMTWAVHFAVMSFRPLRVEPEDITGEPNPVFETMLWIFGLAIATLLGYWAAISVAFFRFNVNLMWTIITETFLHYLAVAKFFLMLKPTTRHEMRIWVTLYSMIFAFNREYGYASMTVEARTKMENGEKDWDEKWIEHSAALSLKHAVPWMPDWMVHPVRVVLVFGTIFWPVFAPMIALTKAGGRHSFLVCWLVFLRRQDFQQVNFEKQFAHKPLRVSDSDRVVTEVHHSSFELLLIYKHKEIMHDLVPDKIRLMAALKHANFPIIQTIDISGKGTKKPLPWFVKPLRDGYGTDCRRVETEEEAALLLPDRDFVQELVINHPHLQPSCGSFGLASVRVFTACPNPESRETHVIDACMCIPLKDSILSNVKRGNMGVVMDLKTGVMGKGGIYSMTENVMPPLSHDRLPGFDKPFTGVKVPYFQEGLELCRKAHSKVLSEAPYLGWDFAVTERGPLLIECNTLCSSSYFGDAMPRLTHARLIDNMLARIQHVPYPF